MDKTILTSGLPLIENAFFSDAHLTKIVAKKDLTSLAKLAVAWHDSNFPKIELITQGIKIGKAMIQAKKSKVFVAKTRGCTFYFLGNDLAEVISEANRLADDWDNFSIPNAM